jgi:hypothetical protein
VYSTYSITVYELFRMVLAAVSPMLKECLTNSEEEEVEIFITDTTPQDIAWIGRNNGGKKNHLFS